LQFSFNPACDLNNKKQKSELRTHSFLFSPTPDATSHSAVSSVMSFGRKRAFQLLMSVSDWPVVCLSEGIELAGIPKYSSSRCTRRVWGIWAFVLVLHCPSTTSKECCWYRLAVFRRST